MSSSTTRDSKAFHQKAGRQFASVRRTVLVALGILVLTLAVNVCVNLVKTEATKTPADREPVDGNRSKDFRFSESNLQIQKHLPWLMLAFWICGAALLFRSLTRITSWTTSWRD